MKHRSTTIPQATLSLCVPVTRTLGAAALFVAIAACRPDPPRADGEWTADTVAVEPPPSPESPTSPRFTDRTPEFEDYAVLDNTFDGAPAPVNSRSAEYGARFRAVLAQGAAEGPNFAGHFTVVTWGCGTACQVVAVVDAVTGDLSQQVLVTARGVSFRRDSGLLVADPQDPQNPDPPDCVSCGTEAHYVWQDGRFHPVGPGPHPHLDGPRPW
jgi:hypothetical protein